MLPAPHRLRARADFTATVRGSGTRRAGGPLVVLHTRPTDPDHPTRVGFVVSKAVGGAVVRNRTKRRLRALVAPRLRAWRTGCDVVVRANPQAAAAASDELGSALDTLARRVGLTEVTS